MKINDIATGWYNLVRKELGLLPSQLQKQSDTRLKICSECQYRNENRCLKCTCFLKAKVVSDSKCPINKW